MKAIPLLAVCAISALVSGCVESVSGDAVRISDSSTSPRSSYRDKLSPELRKQLDRARELQKVDPCSLIDLDAAGRLATITSVGTAAKPINCEIEYQVPQQPATYPDEGLSDAPGLPRLLQSGQRYSVTGGTEAVDHVGSMCFKRLFTGYEDAEGKEMISYSLSVSGNAIGAQDPTPRCQDLEPLVNASRPFAAHPTLRADSRRLPQSKLMNVDPCAVIDALSGQPKVEISTPIYPFSCAFKPEGGTKRSITLLFEEADAARRSIESAKSGRSSVNKYLDLLGAPATISASGGDCMLIAYPDLDRPISGSDPLSQKPWIPKVMVNAEDENASCPKAVEAATEVVRLYKEAK